MPERQAGARTGRVAGGDVDLSSVGALLAEPARARILQALLDGRALPAGLLATEAGVAASTASAHLHRLLEGDLVAVEHHGRHRYYRLAGDGVADALEVLALLAPIAPVRSLRDDTRARALRRARTCYDHLAGALGVAAMASLLDKGLLAGHDGSFRPGTERLSSRSQHPCYRLTAEGEELFRRLGIDVRSPSRRPLLRHCVDWSEQRHHVSGRLGAAFTAHLCQRDWIEPAGVRRAVRVTPSGAAALHDLLDLDCTGFR